MSDDDVSKCIHCGRPGGECPSCGNDTFCDYCNSCNHCTTSQVMQAKEGEDYRA